MGNAAFTYDWWSGTHLINSFEDVLTALVLEMPNESPLSLIQLIQPSLEEGETWEIILTLILKKQSHLRREPSAYVLTNFMTLKYKNKKLH